MFKRLRELDPEVHLIFLGAIVFLLVGYLTLHKRFNDISIQLKTLKEDKTESIKPSEKPGITLDEVKNLIKDSLTTSSTRSISSGQASTTSNVATKESAKKVVYIPLGGSLTTSSREWTDFKSAETYLDVEGDYGKDAKVYFEASLRSVDGASVVYARLFDVTHSIAVNTSDISIAKADFTVTSSPNLYLWRGKNLYRVQLKSPNGSDMVIDNIKIKIVY